MWLRRNACTDQSPRTVDHSHGTTDKGRLCTRKNNRRVNDCFTMCHAPLLGKRKWCFVKRVVGRLATFHRWITTMGRTQYSTTSRGRASTLSLSLTRCPLPLPPNSTLPLSRFDERRERSVGCTPLPLLVSQSKDDRPCFHL